MKTMLRILILSALGVFLLLSGPPASAQQGNNALPTTERLFGLSKVWQEIAAHSVAFAHRSDCDWDSLYQAYVPLVIKSASDYEYYRTLQRFAASMHEAGTMVTFPKHIADSLIIPPVVIREIRGRFYITNTDKQLADKLPVGSEVIRINGFEIRGFLEQHMLPYISASTAHGRMAAALEAMLEGWVNTRVLLNCVTPDGRNINEMVDRAPHSKMQWVREQASREPLTLTWANSEVAVIRLNKITPATIATFPDAKQLARAKALILDLRGNNHPQPFFDVASLVFRLTELPYVVLPGYASRAYPFLFSSSSPESFGQMIQTPDFKHITGDTLFRPAAATPPLSLPIVIITGPGTGYSAEHFLMLMKQALPNMMVVGERTAGSTGYSLPTDLPGGGKIWVNVRYDNYVEDDWFREGYIPDVTVPLDLKSLLNGEDLPLINALNLLLQR